MDFPDDTSQLYRIFQRCDRRTLRIRRFASRRLSGRGVLWLGVLFLILIPILTITVVLVHRASTRHILLAGFPGTTEARLAARLQDIFNAPSALERLLHVNLVPDFSVRPSCGALDTVDQVTRGAAQVGFAEDGLPAIPGEHCPWSPAPTGRETHDREGAIRILALAYQSPLHLIARRQRGWKDLSDIPPGTSAYLGPMGSATRFLAQRILEQYGLRVQDTASDLDFRQAAEALGHGRVDLAFFLTALEEDVPKRLLDGNSPFVLLSIGRAETLHLLYPYLEPLKIPPSLYGGMPTEVVTVATRTALVASSALPEWDVYTLAEQISNHAHDWLADVPLNMAQRLDSNPAKDALYRIHDGAERYANRNPPFFLDWHTLTAIGTYFSMVYAAYAVMKQFLHHYRMHRLFLVIDRACVRFFSHPHPASATQVVPHLWAIRRISLRLLRRRQLAYDEFNRVEEYIRAYHP